MDEKSIEDAGVEVSFHSALSRSKSMEKKVSEMCFDNMNEHELKIPKRKIKTR